MSLTVSLQPAGEKEYTWDIFDSYDIFKVNELGNLVQQLTDHPGYDAEGVISPDGLIFGPCTRSLQESSSFLHPFAAATWSCGS